MFDWIIFGHYVIADWSVDVINTLVQSGPVVDTISIQLIFLHQQKLQISYLLVIPSTQKSLKLWWFHVISIFSNPPPREDSMDSVPENDKSETWSKLWIEEFKSPKTLPIHLLLPLFHLPNRPPHGPRTFNGGSYTSAGKSSCKNIVRSYTVHENLVH